MPTLCFVSPFIAGAIGSLFTTSQITTWYAHLVQPSWTPPAWVFAPVWTTLYLLMGIAALLVWRARRSGRAFVIKIFFLQLVLNALWSIIFFGLHASRFAFAIIVLLWMLILWLVFLFARQSRTAAWLLLPYLLWVSYAATLNLGIILLN